MGREAGPPTCTRAAAASMTIDLFAVLPDSESLVCRFPMPEQRGQRRWRGRSVKQAIAIESSRKQQYWDQLDFRHKVGLIGDRKPEKPWPRARAKVTFHVWNIMDADNAEARMKWIWDWLVQARYIVDDSPRVLECDGLIEQVIHRSDGPGGSFVIVQLWRLS